MTKSTASFDWQAFVSRVAVVLGVTSWMLVERIQKHDRLEIVVTILFGYVVLPVLVYWYTAQSNRDSSSISDYERKAGFRR